MGHYHLILALRYQADRPCFPGRQANRQAPGRGNTSLCGPTCYTQPRSLAEGRMRRAQENKLRDREREETIEVRGGETEEKAGLLRGDGSSGQVGATVSTEGSFSKVVRTTLKYKVDATRLLWWSRS